MFVLTVLALWASIVASTAYSTPLNRTDFTYSQEESSADRGKLRGVVSQGLARTNLSQDSNNKFSTKIIYSQPDRRNQDNSPSDCGCSNELQLCRDAALDKGNQTVEVTKCELYNFECSFLCKGTSDWTCETHCASDFTRCLITEDETFCNEKKNRCIACCPEEPTSSPSLLPTPSPTTSTPTSSPTNIPTKMPSLTPTSIPSKSFSPTNENNDSIIGVPIFPNTATLKTITLPRSNDGVLYKLVKKVNTECEDATSAPYFMPTVSPTKMPTALPLAPPTFSPTPQPTFSPSSTPTTEPTPNPTSEPTTSPTPAPIAPTRAPTTGPTSAPTISPTPGPIAPTHVPTGIPTLTPTSSPTSEPTASPTSSPVAPTPNPTTIPTPIPTSPPDTEDKYVLLEGGTHEKCPGGWEIVSPEECLLAANDVAEHITSISNKEDGPLVYDWSGLPCGCFIYNDSLIDFDTNCQNSGAAPANVDLVCKKKDHMLMPAGAFDKCPDGLEVAEANCLDAAKSLTEHTDTIDKENLLVDDWIGLPCGCFVYDDKRINYDSNCDNRGFHSTSNIVCKQNIILPPTPAPAPTDDSNDGYILYRGSEYAYSRCPEGRDVEQSECLTAANSVTAGLAITNRLDGPMVYDWNFTPCGCFVYNDQLIDYDTNCQNKQHNVHSDLVCKKASTSQRLLNTDMQYVRIAATDSDRCPAGTEVPLEDCLIAANSVSDGYAITNRDTGPLQYDWSGLPCGCFIWDKKLIDFDSFCGNSGPQELAELVCLDPSLITRSPSAAPVPAPPKPPKIFPAGRSYDGNAWEATHPILLSYSCDDNNQCTVDLPPEECSAIHYVIEKFESEPLSPEKEAARMLLQTTFGPTKESIGNVVNSHGTNITAWIHSQMDEAITPISSHREHYRKRSNSHVRQGLDGFGLRDACASGSRWNRFAFNRYRDVGKQIILEPFGGRYIMKVDGLPRTEIDASALTVLNTGTYFNVNGALYICRGMSEFFSEPGAQLILANSPGDCITPNKVGHIAMPSVEFTDPASLGLNVYEVALEDLNPTVLDAKLLSSSMIPCTLKQSWPNLVKDTNSGQYFVEDRRVVYLDMIPSSVTGSGLSTKTCPSAPKSSFNEASCIVRSDCSPPKYQTSSGFLTLDVENIRKFYDLAGHYVYRASNLPIITDPVSRYEMFSPCNDANTFKRFDWDPFRFVRKGAAGQACSPDTPLDASIKNVISQALVSELEKTSDLVERREKRVLDLVMPKGACYDPFKTARGASITIYDPSLQMSTCWTHSHPNEWSVYNFDKWVMFHPGNLDAYLGDKKNPIAAFAESSENEEDMITIIMPSWHPSDRFQDTKAHREYVGNFGDKIHFGQLPPSIQEDEVAEAFGAIRTPDLITEYIEVCESPFEVSNDPKLGHQYRLNKGGDTGWMSPDTLDQDGWGWNGKNRVFNTVSTYARDQLRQRVAWVLSSIFVVTAVDINTQHSTEAWSSYHDIFVKNAFGNYFDVLKEVSFHPLMAKMLTYHKSRSMSHNFEKDGLMLFPDENYAREIMQLFSIGLYKLNKDGTKIIDEETGKPAETYTNEDIMTFARAWTNFQRRQFRPNLEVFSDFIFSDNEVDPMHFPTSDGRDVFPKLGLDDGGRKYIGDKTKRCDTMPSRPWLRKGAKYVFRGTSPNPEYGRKDPAFWDNYPTINRIILNSSSNLHTVLCNADPATGSCRFESSVFLTEDIECVGTCIAGESDNDPISGTQPCECSIDEPRTVRVDDPASVDGSHPSVWYEYVRDECIQMAFPESGHMKSVSEVGKHWGNYGNDAMCADTRLAVAGTTCCDQNNANPRNICIFRGERTTYDTAKQRCAEKGLVTCAWSSVPVSHYCGTDIEWWDSEHEAVGMRFSWTNQDCSMDVQIDEKGYIAMIHDTGTLSQEVKGRVRIDSGTYFRVLWEGSTFPSLQDCEGMSGCRIHSKTCICGTSVETSLVFDGTNLPTKNDILSKLHIGSYDPSLFDDGTYFKCIAPACISLSSQYSMYFTLLVSNDNDIAAAVDENTIFEIMDPLTWEKVYLSNTKSIVRLGSGFAFRNPPIYNSPVDQTQRDALYETDAVIQHYASHSNTAPFMAMRLIQHLVTSNPSPRYVSVVSDAFTKGSYEGFGSGKYGDFEAAVAAVFLDKEARSSTLDMDSTHGKSREPLLMVLHYFRSMELDTKDGRSREVDLIFMKDKIGQEAYYAPSVFSFFLPEYQPIGPVLDLGLVAPETQLFDAPKLIGFLNGLVSLSHYGLQDCESGFGFLFDRYAIPDHPDNGWNGCHEILNEDKHVPHRLRWSPASNSSPQDVVSEMDLLLTGGRLSSTNHEIITRAYENKLASDSETIAVQEALSLFAAAPEFHITNKLFSNETGTNNRTVERIVNVPTVPNNPPPVTDYKAIVYLYLQGALDSYNLLMPLNCAGDLNTQYHQVRGHVAVSNHLQLPISAPLNTQPCSTFGVHPKMGYVQQTYIQGDASFVANIGPLYEHLDKVEFEEASKRTPPSLFAHNVQTGETQGVATGDSKAGGVIGRIGDALNLQAGKEIFDAYSISGTPKVLEGAPGVSRPADVLTTVGVATFTQSATQIETNIKAMNKNVADSIFGETFSESISSAIARKDLLGDTIEESTLPTQTENCYKNLEKLETGIHLQFKQVSRIIQQRHNLQAKRDVFYLQLGSFDQHGGDGYTDTAIKLSEINDSLPCFVEDLKLQGLWNDVTIMSASEFGRTLTSNGQGTDHAWGGNHFLMGGAIKGGKIHGNYPDDLTDQGPLNIGRGRLIPTTSWEGVWKGVAEWFGVEDKNMATVLPNLGNFQKNIYGKNDLYN